MKLKNKKTGGIMQLSVKCENGGELKTFDSNTNTDRPITLAELNEEWEDYKEPKNPYFINWFGEVSELLGHISDREIEKLKEAGNYFETKEEAEKAVEKLKAWKRLKDNGFEFTGWDRHPDYPGDFRITASDEWTCDDKDLDLLFGGEE